LKSTSFEQESYFSHEVGQPEAGSSSRHLPPPSKEEETWDEETYENCDRKGSPRLENDDNAAASSNGFLRHPTDMIQPLEDYDNNPAGIPEPSQDGFWEDEDEDDETRFVNFSLLSHIAMQLRDKVPRGTHVKGSIPYPRAFTGKDIVVRYFFSP